MLLGFQGAKVYHQMHQGLPAFALVRATVDDMFNNLMVLDEMDYDDLKSQIVGVTFLDIDKEWCTNDHIKVQWMITHFNHHNLLPETKTGQGLEFKTLISKEWITAVQNIGHAVSVQVKKSAKGGKEEVIDRPHFMVSPHRSWTDPEGQKCRLKFSISLRLKRSVKCLSSKIQDSTQEMIDFNTETAMTPGDDTQVFTPEERKNVMKTMFPVVESSHGAASDTSTTLAKVSQKWKSLMEDKEETPAKKLKS